MRLRFWNKCQMTDLLPTQLARNGHVVVRQFECQLLGLEAFYLLAVFPGSECWYVKAFAFVHLLHASCMNTKSIFWCLFQKHNLIVLPTLHFKNFSSLYSLCVKFLNTHFDISIWITHFYLWEISEILFLRIKGLNRGSWLQFDRFWARSFSTLWHGGFSSFYSMVTTRQLPAKALRY